MYLSPGPYEAVTRTTINLIYTGKSNNFVHIIDHMWPIQYAINQPALTSATKASNNSVGESALTGKEQVQLLHDRTLLSSKSQGLRVLSDLATQ